MMKTQSSHSHDEDAVKSLTARTNKLKKLVLELEGVLEVTMNDKTLLKQELFFRNTNTTPELSPTALP